MPYVSTSAAQPRPASALTESPDNPPGPVICFSAGLKKLPGLDLFLGGPVIKASVLTSAHNKIPTAAGPPRAVAVWGQKSGRSHGRACRFARQSALPLWHLEDGFLRSLDLGGRGSTPLSLILDHKGIYYDATNPSDLENLLNSSGWESPELLTQAREALAAIIEADLSKYNYCPPAPPELLGDGSRRRILVIDQTQGDRSVALGLAGLADFNAMVLQARADDPEALIFIKSHPETAAGLKDGYLTSTRLQPRPGGIRLTQHMGFIPGNYSPLSLLAQADEVYTVTSQMGFEALMLGKKVHCFGLPFYAGWGQTLDYKTCPRRLRTRSFLEIFAAAYLLYPRYLNPIRGELTDIFEVIRLLSLQRQTTLANRGRWRALGFSFWKRSQARAYLGTPGAELTFGSEKPRGSDEDKNCRLLAWSSKWPDRSDYESPPLVRMEDGFLRSAGLGCDLQRPYSLILDPEGIYYDQAPPSRLEKILAEYDFTVHPDLLARAAELRQALVAAGLGKYNQVGRNQWNFARPPGRAVLLVPGQVEDDDSIKKGSPLVKSNLELLRLVRETRPEAYIVYKPHPDVEAGRRRGALERERDLRYADLVLNETAPEALWPHIDEVHTMTSLLGFEALLRHKRVHSYGGPFYAGWGLTEDLLNFERRSRSLTLDELTAGALILYPRYYDWPSGLFCDPEDILHALLRARPGGRKQNFFRHLAEECLHLSADFIKRKLRPAR